MSLECRCGHRKIVLVKELTKVNPTNSIYEIARKALISHYDALRVADLRLLCVWTERGSTMWVVIVVLTSKITGLPVGAINYDPVYGSFSSQIECERSLLMDYSTVSNVTLSKERGKLSVIINNSQSESWRVSQCVQVKSN